jgi:DNA-binding PadR family transcriptional regulator
VPPPALKPQWYYILLSLAAGHHHGLAIARAVREFSDGRVRLWPAMLYGSLQALAARGWIRELEDGSAGRPDASERKRYYSLTRAGRTAMDAETRRLADLVKLARTVSRREPT